MRCGDVIKILQKQAAETYALEWDNVGLLVGSREQEIQKVYIALDATDAAIQEALDFGADMLLTHHPLIFKGVKRITEEDFIGRRLIAMIRGGMACYAMHTNFDVKGMAELAAERLGLLQTVPLEVTCEKDGISQGIGRCGWLKEPISLSECCTLVKNAFCLEHVTVFGSLNKMVKRAAICPGAGKSNLEDALLGGADVYITGDIDHHSGIDAVARGMAVIDAGHYGIEHIFVAYMAHFLREQAPGLEVMTQGAAEPFQIL